MNHRKTGSRVNICLQGCETTINLSLDTAYNLARKGSALQRPHIRKAELAAMLRRALKKQQSRKTRKTYWSALLASCTSKNANNNSLETTVRNDN